jgi:hypothetical protein
MVVVHRIHTLDLNFFAANARRNNKKDPNDLANLGEKRMGAAIKEKPKFDPRDEARDENRFIGLKV